jgi:peptidylprolyl isomerase
MRKLFSISIIIVIFLISCKPKQSIVLNQWYTTASGLKYMYIKFGSGEKPVTDDKVYVHYTGKFADGKVFDDSYSRNEPIAFQLGKGMVIKGWDEGIALLKVGDKASFIIPPALGYGSKDLGIIPPNSTLYFDVELIKIEKVTTPVPFDVTGKDTITTKSGLKYIMIQEGTGLNPIKGNTVKVHYTGYFKDGSIFDSSVSRGEAFEFKLGMKQVISGWDEGIALLKKGGKARLIIPPALAYGSEAMGPIPGNSTLIFDVELIDFK